MPRPRLSSRASRNEPLALFFTRGVSLGTWDERGILDRELAVYRELAARGRPVTFVTYGDAADLRYRERLGGIRVLANERGLPLRAYWQLLPLLHARALAGAGVFKANQVYGGIAARRSARLHRRPLVARCGFLWTEAADAEDGPGSLRARFVENRERRLVRGADVVVVTSARLAARVRGRHGVPAKRIVVIPNFVDVRRFQPARRRRARARSCSSGGSRVRRTSRRWSRRWPGSTALRSRSWATVRCAPGSSGAEQLGANARFLGKVQHEELPAILAEAEAFALPSLYEGHPKAAIEAMACGLPVIGTDVPGIRDLVRDGESGVLSGTSAAELRAAIETGLGDPALRRRLGQGARAAVEPLSLERTVEASRTRCWSAPCAPGRRDERGTAREHPHGRPRRRRPPARRGGQRARAVARRTSS